MSCKITLLPLDSRPVNVSLPESVARQGDFCSIRSPVRFLGGLKKPADRLAACRFLLDGHDSSAAVVSIDMLAYGGLVQSRTGETSPGAALNTLSVLKEFREKFPKTPLYAFVTVPRDALTVGDSESFSSWKLQMKGVSGAGNPVRQRNLDIIHEMIRLTGDGVIDFLSIGKEDTAKGNPFSEELCAIESEIKQVCPGRAALAAGADELSLLMTARAIAEKSGRRPKLFFEITKQQSEKVPAYEPFPFIRTLENQALAAGAEVAETRAEADIVIVVHSAGRQRDLFLDQISGSSERPTESEKSAKRTVSLVKKAVAQGAPVAIIDAEHLNGSSSGLIKQLLDEKLYFRLASYAGWNTAANSSGTVIAHVVADFAGEGSTPRKASRRIEFMAERLFSDYFFSVVARGRAVGMTADPFIVGNHTEVSSDTAEIINREAGKTLKKYLSGKSFPADSTGVRNVRFKEMNAENIILPWRRLFEADIRLNLKFELL